MRSLRRGLAAALLALPLIAGLATGAQAQTVGTVQFAADTLTYPEATGSGSTAVLQTGVTIFQTSGSIAGSPIISLTATDGTAKRGTDYNLRAHDMAPFQVFVQYGLTAHTPSNSGVWTYPNDDDEPDKSFTWTMSQQLSNDPRYNLGTRTTATVIIRDDDPTIVSLTRSGTGSVTEGSGTDLTVSLGRKLIAGEVIEVPLSITNTDTTNADWSLAKKSGAGVALTGTVLKFTGTGTTLASSQVQTAVVTLTAVHDALTSESDETMTVAVVDGTAAGQLDQSSLDTNVGGGANPGTNNSVSLTIANTATAPSTGHTVSVSVSPAQVTEGTTGATTDATVTVSVSPAPTSATPHAVYRLCFSGTATRGTDYEFRSSSGSLIAESSYGNGDCIAYHFSANQATAANIIRVTGDTDMEPDETVIVTARKTISTPADVTISPTAGSATLTIKTDDGTGKVLTLAGTGGDVSEGGTFPLTVQRPAGSDSSEAIGYTLSWSGTTATTATAGIDFKVQRNKNGNWVDIGACSGGISGALGAGEMRHQYRVRVINDAYGETPETIHAFLLADDGVALQDASKTYTIRASDGGGPAQPAAWTAGFRGNTESTVAEDVGTVNVRVQFHPDAACTPKRHSFLWVEFGGSADIGTDYTLPNDDDVLIDGGTPQEQWKSTDDWRNTSRDLPANQRWYLVSGKESFTIPIAITDDTHEDSGEKIEVTIKDSKGYVVGAETHTITITNDDPGEPEPVSEPEPEPQPAFVPDAALVAAVTAKADGHANPEAAARLRRIVKGMTGEDGGYTAEECRETATSFGVLPVWTPWCDEIARREAHEAAAAQDATPPDPGPEISISAGADVTEGGNATFTLTATPAPATPLSVDVTVTEAGGYATAGARTVTIPTTGTAELRVATANDDTDEPDGSVTATLASGTGYTLSATANAATVAVADDDDAAPATFAPDAALIAQVTAKRDGFAPSHPAHGRLDKVLKGMTGEAGGYTAAECRETATDFGVLSTWKPWCDEIARREAHGANAAPDATPKDPTPTVPEISIAAGSGVTEGGDASFTVTAAPAPAADLTVALAVSEAQGSDYVASGDEGTKSVTILAGETEAAFTVATVDDGADEPDGSVTATLAAGTGYTVAASPGDAATVAVADNDAPGGATVSISDARAQEGNGTRMTFTLTLSEPVAQYVAVFYRTRDSSPRSAEAKVDYIEAQGWTLIKPNETTGAVRVYLRDDAHDEGEETFEVELVEVTDNAVIADGVGVGTIVNSDPMPAAWLARFGRTVAEQALGGISDRMAANRTPGMQGSLGGQAISFGPGSGSAPQVNTATGATLDRSAVHPDAMLTLADIVRSFDDEDGMDEAGHGFGTAETNAMTGRDLLLGSSFSLTGETDASGGSMAFWGRAAHGTFDGEERGDGTTLGLDGEVTTGMLGADYAREKWLVGLALTLSEGEGGYRDTDPAPPPPVRSVRSSMDGRIESSLTAAIPYAALQASERLKLWGALGYGTGEVTLTPTDGDPMKADTEWTMAAAGLRGDVIAPPAEGSGPALAIVSDAMWANTASEKTAGLAASDSDVTRLRLGLEGSWHEALEGGGNVTPKLELGMRHDGGDAETGFGVELGGGIAWVDPDIGLSLDVSGRTLLAHEDGDLKDRGLSASLAFDPDPASERGLSLSLRQEIGGQANGGLDALFAPDPLEDRTGGEATSRWSAEAAYGFPAFSGRFTASPHVGLGLSGTSRDLSLGWRWTPAQNAPDLSFGLKATRVESEGTQPEHTAGLEAIVRW